jgi:hypothetical protein
LAVAAEDDPQPSSGAAKAIRADVSFIAVS